MRRLDRIALYWLVIGTCATPALAGPARFTLDKAVPQGVYVYAHWVPNPEREFADEYWSSVLEALWATKIDEDVRDLISSFMTEEADRESFNESWDGMMALLRQVGWAEMFGHEGVYTARMQLPASEHLVITRSSKAIVERNAPRVKGVLDQIAQLAGGEEWRVSETTVHGATVWVLPLHPVPLPICAAHKGDVLAIGFGHSLLTDALGLLAGESDQPSLIDEPRFKRAMSALPEPEDGRAFIDVRAIVRALDEFLGKVESPTTTQEAPGANVLRVVRRAVQRCDFVDYSASVGLTEELRTVTHEITALVPGAEKKPLYKVFCKQAPFTHFERNIPQAATSFSLWGGLDLAALYREVLGFIADEWPDGDAVLADWKRIQDEIRFHPDSDLFGWLSGQIISISLPAAGEGPGESGGSVVMIKVRDPKAASTKVKAALDRLSNALANIPVDEADPMAMLKTMFRLPLTSQPAEDVGAEGFRTVTHPICAAFLNPVYGVWRDWLIVGTSEPAVAAVIATAKGEQRNIATSQRFKREGLAPKGPASAVSFSDLRKIGEEIGRMLDSVLLIGTMAQMIPDERAGKVFKSLLLMVGKLGPVARKVDFLLSQASVTTFDGKSWRTRSVMNYREPGAEPTTQPTATTRAARRWGE